MPTMTSRQRKLLGGVVMIVFVIAYALIAMALAQARAIQESGKILQALFFAVLGIGWIVPLMPLIRWMEKR